MQEDAIRIRVLKDLEWDIVGHPQGSERSLPGKLPKKSEKGFSGPLGPGVKKRFDKESKMTIFQAVGSSSTCFRFFKPFFGPGAERPRKPLFRLLSEFPRKRPFDPSKFREKLKGNN